MQTVTNRAKRSTAAGAALSVLALTLTACAATPAYQRETTTLGEVDISGLECRDEAPITSLRKRTVCASPEQWAEYDALQRERIEDFDRNRTSAGRNPFGR